MSVANAGSVTWRREVPNRVVLLRLLAPDQRAARAAVAELRAAFGDELDLLPPQRANDGDWVAYATLRVWA